MHIRTLPSVIIGVVGVMVNRLVKALECFFRDALVPCNTGQLNKTLCKGNGFNEVDLGSIYVAGQEFGDVMIKIRLVDQRDVMWLHT